MWATTRRMAGKALDELELLRREVQALQWDMQKMQEQVQRAIWRRKSAPAEESTAAAASSADGAPSVSAPVSSLDPVSAKLLARRGRPRGGPPEEMTQRASPQDEE